MAWVKASKVLGKYQGNRQFRAAYICSVAQEVLGDEAKVISFRDGSLVLAVPSSPQAANIQIQAQLLLKAINLKIGDTQIKQFRFRLG